jgi:signal transduction histidine kinase
MEVLTCRGKLLGLLGLRRAPHRPAMTLAQRDALAQFCAAASIALTNASLHDQLSHRAKELSALLQTTHVVMAGTNLDETLDRLAEMAARISGSPHLKVAIAEQGNDTLRVRAARGTPGFDVGDTIPVSGTLSGRVFTTGQHYYSPNSSADPHNSHRRDLDAKQGLVTYLGFPIRTRGSVVGVLTFATYEPRHYSQQEIRYLQSFADHAALSVEKLRLYEELERAYQTQQRAHEELIQSEKLRALGELAAGMAHDLNNTLAVILGQAEFVAHQASSPAIKQAAELIIQTASNGHDVVRRVQAFARRSPALPLMPCHLPTLVQDALDLTRARWKVGPENARYRITPHVQLGGLPPIRGNPPEIREALINLILNAVDAMPTGGSLPFAARVVPRTPGTDAPTWVDLTVQDTGTGIPEAFQHRVFDPFFSTKGTNGTGLGLPVVHGIMQRHGGSIALQSTSGQGTAFLTSPIPASADNWPSPSTFRRS